MTLLYQSLLAYQKRKLPPELRDWIETIVLGFATIDDRNIETDGVKLDTIEGGSAGDQTGAEIVALLEALVGAAQFSHDKLSDVSTDDHHAADHSVVSHNDTTGTGAELNTLTDNSMADSLHRHSELSASDGTPDAVVRVDSNGSISLGIDGGEDVIYLSRYSDSFNYVELQVGTNDEGKGVGLQISYRSATGASRPGVYLSDTGVFSVGGSIVVDEATTDYVTLTDNSMADALHRHSELVASDGSPDPALSVDADGQVDIGNKLNVADVIEADTTVDDGTNVAAIRISEGDNQATGRNSLEFYNKNHDYIKARLWTQVGSTYLSPVFGIDVADASSYTDKDVFTRLVIDKDGNVGVATTSPSQPLSVKEKFCISAIGGQCIKLTNKTGANSIAGAVVTTSIGTDDAVMSAVNDELEPIGIFLESGVVDGSEAWVVVGGIADVAMENNTAATRGNWVRTSITEGPYADATNAAAPGHGIGNADIHFHEIGHCIETVTAGGEGTHILARCVLHFN